MTVTEAKMILEMEGNDPQEARDCYEECVFQQIQIFLKDPFIPNLSASRLEKIKTYWDAFSVFEMQKENTIEIITINSLKDIINWKDFFQMYEINKAIIRKEISKSFSFELIQTYIHLLERNEREYAGILIGYFEGKKMMFDSKISERIQIIDILKECENLKDKNVLDDSLESFSKIPENMITFNLSKEVNRLRKMFKNG